MDLALASAKASRVAEKVIKCSFFIVFQHLYDGMTVLEAARSKTGLARQKLLSWAKKIIKRFELLWGEKGLSIFYTSFFYCGVNYTQ